MVIKDKNYWPIPDLVGLTKESVTAKGGRDLLNSATPVLRKFGEEMMAAYKDGKISEDEKKQLMKTGKGIDEKFSKAFGKGVDIFKKLGDYAKDFPGEVMKALDAATENLEGQTGESNTSSTQTKSGSEQDILNQKDKNIMDNILAVNNKNKGQVQQPATSNNQNSNNQSDNYEKTIANATEALINSGKESRNGDITNNTTTNTNYDQKTFIDQTQKTTSKMASNSDLFDLSPMVNLQGEQLTASKGSLTELQTLNSNITRNNETLISAMSKISEQKENFTEPTKEISTTIVQKTEPKQNTVTPEINMDPLADLQKDQISLSKNNFDLMSGYFSNKNQGDDGQLSKSLEEISSKMSNNGDLTSIEGILPTQKELLTSTDLMVESINKMDENLISYVSNLDNKDINKIEVKIPEQTGIESQKPTIGGNEQNVQSPEMITNNITNNSLAQQITNPVTNTQNNATSFDGKLTIDVNITAPPGVDTAAIKEVVTQTMYDSKVRENISKSMINPRIGSYNPTTGIPT